MKRLFNLFVLASVLIAGCTKEYTETDTEVPREDLKPMTFSASVPESKASIDISLNINWSEGDKIGIFDGAFFREFTLKSGAGTTSAVFEGEAAKADSYIAVYPYKENLAIDSEGKIHGLSVPCVQDAGACPVIMTAESKNGSNAFAFKSALAYVKVTPGFNCHKVVLETYESDSDGRALCGDVEIASGAAQVVENSCNHVILSGEILLDNSYFIAVAPKRLENGFKVIFDDAVNAGDPFDNGLQYTRKSDKTPELVRGRVLNLGAFSKESTDWTEDGVNLASFEMEDQDKEEFDDRAIYDWKDCLRIVASCEKTDTSKTSRIYFLEDIDFDGRVILPSLFNIPRGNVRLYGLGHKIANYVQGSMTVDNCGHAGLFIVDHLGSFCVEDLSLYPKQFKVSSGELRIFGGAFLSSSFCSDSLRIRNCKVHGDIKVTCKGNEMSCAGGFAGIVESRGKLSISDDTQPEVYMENCLVEGTVTAYSEDDEAHAGGFFGYLDGCWDDYICVISRCRNKAVILSEGDEDSAFLSYTCAVSAGGIVGGIRDVDDDVVPRLISCVNEGSVTAHAMDNDNAFAGGIVGFQDSDGCGDRVPPYLSNCLNKGSVTAVSDDGIAGGLVGYCHDDDTVFRNCVDDGELSGKKCAHISGSYGSYDSSEPCIWTKNDDLYGIYDKEEKDGYRVIIRLETLNSRGYDAIWSKGGDGHLDLDIIH